MKTTKAIFGILTITAALATQVHAQSFLTNGLVAYYPFNGNADDASDNGNNGIVKNAVLTQDNCGWPASAYDFDSADCNITSPFQGVAGSSPRTVSCWVKQADVLRTTKEDVINWDVNGACATAFSCGFNTDSTLGADKFYFGVSIEVGCGRIVYDQGPWDGLWHQYVWVVPNVKEPSLCDVEIFKDGLLLTRALWYYREVKYCSTVLLNSTPQDMTIPRWGTPDGFGSIDNLRVYNRALSASQVMQLYDYEFCGLSVALLKAVKPSFSNLKLTTNYQLQVSAGMDTWANEGSPFAATNTTMIYPQYFDVENWGKLFFRLQVAP